MEESSFGWKIYLGVGLVGLVGLGLVGYGVWEEIRPREVKVEIIKNEKSFEIGDVVVDVAGAVEKPGVYTLPSGSRIGDALVVAGGLSANADRAWVSQNVNLAEPIKDGGKIYIPANQKIKPLNQSTIRPLETHGKININTASVGELDSLPGIGSVRASTIISNRPYGSIEELVSKAKIPQSVYEDITNLVSVY